MTWDVDDNELSELVEVDGAPNEAIRPGEPSRWECFKKFVSPWLRKGSDLADRYGEAKLLQEKSKAAKTMQEAAQIAVKTELQRLENIKVFNTILDAIFADDGLPGEAKLLKLEKLSSEDPEFAAQVEKVKYTLETLWLKKGVSIAQPKGLLRSEGTSRAQPDSG